MIKKVPWLGLVLLISACSTNKVSYLDAQEVALVSSFVEERDTDSRVTFVRDSGLQGSGCTFNLFSNDKLVGSLNPKEKITINISSGEYVFSIKLRGGLCGTREWKLESNLKSGQHKFYRIGFDMNGIIFQIDGVQNMR